MPASDSDLLAAAAHMHVLLRRKTGRVTDTEWMATDAEYARAMVEFAREKARANRSRNCCPWPTGSRACWPAATSAGCAEPAAAPQAPVRIQRAAFSAIISVGLLVLPLVMVGMAPASTTRRLWMPRTRK